MIRRVTVFAFAVFVFFAPTAASAQRNVGGRNEVFAGSDLESYLRYLQTLGKSESYPFSIRAFSPQEIDGTTFRSESTTDWSGRSYGPR